MCAWAHTNYFDNSQSIANDNDDICDEDKISVTAGPAKTFRKVN